MKNTFNFRSFFTFIDRNKGYTAINVLGLSLSLMFVVLISIYTTQELSVDAYQEKGDRMCVLASESNFGTAFPIGDRLKERYPEIEAICPVAFRTEPVIAIVISLLGLLAMSTYFIQQRVSEIAVRKVFGSTEAQVLKKLIWVFLSYVGIAFVIAVPIIWYVMNDWLSGYSYRISLSPWIFVAAGLFCFIVSFAAVFVQSYRAANADPVKNIRVT